MITYLKNRFQDKSILILGFGREGQSSLRILLEAGGYKKIAIGDKKQLSLDDQVFKNPDLQGYNLSQIEFCCGDDYLDYMDCFDIVMKSPGIVLGKELCDIQAEISSQMQLFFEFYRDRIIGVTGTKGKSTTTTLLHCILKNSGKDAILAGNIGIPVFDIIHEIKDESIFTIELSCHQLEYTTVSPKWSILLNIYEEHLDHYGSMEKYVAAKENIYRNQKSGDVLFVNPLNAPSKDDCHADIKKVDMILCKEASDCAGQEIKVDIKLRVSESDCNVPTIAYGDRVCAIPTNEISLLGLHNYLDIAYVYGVCCEFGISDDEFISGLKAYVPLPHRLQNIGTYDGVTYFDDSISTIDETTIQALNTIKNADTVIIGGMDREISYEALEEYLAKSEISNIILMEATGKRIYEEIQQKDLDFKNKERLLVVEHLQDAVDLAKRVTKEGCSCVLSPAAASYGIFKNFEERGDVFAQLVRGESH